MTKDAGSVQAGAGVPGRLWTPSFLLVVAGTFLMAAAFFSLLPVLPVLVVGPMGLGEREVGLVVGVFSATSLAVRPFGGFLLDRFGRRIWLLLGAIALVACMAAYTGAATLASLLGLRLVHGLAWGFATVTTATVVADLVPAVRRGVGMGFYGMAMPLAMALGPMAGSMLMEGGQFGRVFTTGALVSAVAVVFFVMGRAPAVRNPATRLSVGAMVEGRVIPVFACMTALTFGLGGWLTFVPLYAPQAGLESAGPIFFWNAVGALSTRLFGGHLYDRFGVRPPVLLGLLLTTLGWTALASSATPLGALGGSCCLGLGFGVLGPVFQAMAIDLVPAARRGAANGTFHSSFDVGIGSGAILFGMAATQEQAQAVFWGAGAMVLVAAGLFFFWTWPHFQRHALRRPGRGPSKS